MVALGLTVALMSTGVRPLDIWIDTDPSMGLLFRDVDDGLALLQAFRTKHLKIRGISVSYGNAGLKPVLSIARNLVSRYARNTGVDLSMVYPGAESAKDQGKATAASHALIQALELRSLVYLGLAPLTNLATVLQLRPDLSGRLEKVLFVGGRSPGQRYFFGRSRYEFHDANFEKDPAAAQKVLESQVALELVPIELSSTIQLTRPHLQEVASTCVDGTRLLWETGLWSFLWEKVVGLKGGPAFDSIAVLAASHPDVFVIEERRAEIKQGQLLAKRSGGGRGVKFYTGTHVDAAELSVRLMCGLESF
jgi:inosine-uridine nucleoside N-ribohydrolase